VKKIFCVLVVFFCFSAHHTIAADVPQAGIVAPTFTLPNQNGQEVSLSDYHGKWIVLYFYPKDFTHGCSIEAHNFQADAAKYSVKNTVIIGVSVDSIESHKSFCTKEGLNFKLLSDTKHMVSEAYGSTMERGEDILSARNSFIIDPIGIVRKTYIAVSPAGHSSEVLVDIEHLQLQGSGKH
jgi:peroxiredoxin Q/BCP